MHYFLTPDSVAPSGGIRKIYQFVDTLNAHGQDAVVVHRVPGFRVTWFDSATPVAAAADLVAGADDVIVLPEFEYVRRGEQFASARTIMLAQNAFHVTHTLAPSEASTFPTHRIASVVTVSQMNAGLIRRLLPGVPVHVIDYSVDAALFAPATKERVITAMPRRRPAELTDVLVQLTTGGVFGDWELDLIDGASEAEVAARLGRAAIFLCFSEREGFGLPPAEAMAAGCLVIGFPGFGGEELLRPDRSLPVPDGDVVAFADTVTRVDREWGSPQLGQLIERGRDYVTSVHTEARQTAGVLRAFEPPAEPFEHDIALAPWAESTPAPSRLRTAVHHVKQAAAAVTGT